MSILLGGGAISACGNNVPDRRPLNIFAASSLMEAFQEMEEAFENVHRDTDVVLTFSGSQILRLQIEQGAGADLFASANFHHMESLARAGLVVAPRVFAHNELAVIVPPDNPAEIRSFLDLRQAKRLVIGTENTPVGAYTRESLAMAAGKFGADFRTDVLRRVVSQESNVRLVRAKVELGEADAAVVYRTDALSGRVRTIPIPPLARVRAGYLIGAIVGTANPGDAERWLGFVFSREGRAILSRRGFLTGSAGPGAFAGPSPPAGADAPPMQSESRGSAKPTGP